MAASQGYGKAVTSGSVFAYDVADTINSYKGEPTTNYQIDWSPWTVGGTNTDVTGTSEAGPVKNAKTWKFQKSGGSDQWNGWESTYGGIWTGNAGDVWTTSYWYKTSAPAGLSGFGVGSFYLSNWSAPYNTTFLGGSTGIIADGQWHYGWATTQFNENYSNAIIVDGPSWGYSNQAGTLYINGLQWEKKSHPTPFAGFTRSATQGLLPLVSTSTIDLSNMSFDSNAQMYFDGTNDYVNATSFTPNFSSGITMECVAYWTSSPGGSWQRMFDFGNGSNSDNLLFCRYGSTDQLWFGIYNGGSNSYVLSNSGAILFGQYALYTATADGTNFKIYVNGNLIYSEANSTIPVTTTRVNGYIGKSNWPDYYFNGQIPVAKMYNRPLTAGEIKQNYNKYKTRFNLS